MRGSSPDANTSDECRALAFCSAKEFGGFVFEGYGVIVIRYKAVLGFEMVEGEFEAVHCFDSDIPFRHCLGFWHVSFFRFDVWLTVATGL
jgi:hypothetical protein